MNLPAIQETQVQSLGREDHQEKGMAKYSCLGNPMDRGTWQVTVHGVARVKHDLETEPHHHIMPVLGTQGTSKNRTG